MERAENLPPSLITMIPASSQRTSQSSDILHAETQPVRRKTTLSRRSRVIQKRKQQSGSWARRHSTDGTVHAEASMTRSVSAAELDLVSSLGKHQGVPLSVRLMGDAEKVAMVTGRESPDSGIGSDHETLSRQSSVGSVCSTMSTDSAVCCRTTCVGDTEGRTSVECSVISCSRDATTTSSQCTQRTDSQYAMSTSTHSEGACEVTSVSKPQSPACELDSPQTEACCNCPTATVPLTRRWTDVVKNGLVQKQSKCESDRTVTTTQCANQPHGDLSSTTASVTNANTRLFTQKIQRKQLTSKTPKTPCRTQKKSRRKTPRKTPTKPDAPRKTPGQMLVKTPTNKKTPSKILSTSESPTGHLSSTKSMCTPLNTSTPTSMRTPSRRKSLFFSPRSFLFRGSDKTKTGSNSRTPKTPNSSFTTSTPLSGNARRASAMRVPTACDFIPRRASIGEQLRRRLFEGTPCRKRKFSNRNCGTIGSTPRRRFTPKKRKVRLLSCWSSPSTKGGTYAEAGAPTSTHLVVDETNIKNIPFDVHHKLHVVKTEWFWASIQMDACADEAMYQFEEPVPAGTPTTRSSCSTPKTISGGKGRKRKRLRDNLRELAADTNNTDSPMYTTKRNNELGRMSLSASFLEVTDPSIKSPESSTRSEGATTPLSGDLSKMSPRQLIVMEMLQTEKNYVGILHTILKVFKEEIESPDQPGGPLLGATDTKIIFGGVGPMYDVHVGIRDELQHAVNNWHNDQSIGQIFLNHAEALLKAYPPFVNFFENTKETITTCDRTKPRFHAFLKVCQSKPECGRQTLAELLIRPVQRLPSVMLLLKEIQKRTERNLADHTQLSEAILKLEEVMTHINEDKRKAEGHQQMFDIINDIDNCPPNLLSSHRNFVLKVDVVEVTDTLSGKGDNLSLFLFTDSLEMCKRRTKVLNAKSPAVVHAPKTPQKAYKHLEMMQLSCIKKVVNITETAECKGVLALITRELNKKEKLYAFMLADDDTDKNDLLRTLSKHISNTTCRADYENLMLSTEASSLHLDVVDLQNRTLSKAATKFGKRVSRAFSFNRTPRKLKRAMSSMSQVMSPFRRESMHGFLNPNNAQTPSNLRGMRLASTNDLTPQEEEEESFYSTLIDSHAAFGNHSFATPKKRCETLAMFQLSGMPPPGGVISPHMSTLSHAASSMTLHRVDLDPKVKVAKVNRRKSVAWRDASSPLFATPSTPNLTLQFTKSATIGHAASKIL